jgi:hypothetical protein
MGSVQLSESVVKSVESAEHSSQIMTSLETISHGYVSCVADPEECMISMRAKYGCQPCVEDTMVTQPFLG